MLLAVVRFLDRLASLISKVAFGAAAGAPPPRVVSVARNVSRASPRTTMMSTVSPGL